MRLRPGYLLAEALCALALAGVLLVAAGFALTGARRSMRAEERRERASRAEREAVALLREAITAGDGILLRGDTAVDLDVLLGTSVLCGLETRAILLPARVAGLGLTDLPQQPAADDLVALRLESPSGEEWWHAVVDSVQDRQDPGACTVADGWRPAGTEAAPLIRIVVRDSLPSILEPGAAVRLARRGRFTLYHAGRGDWMLGWRRCHPLLDVCGVVQPVAGPLRPPSAGGLRLREVTAPPGLAIEARGADGGQGAIARVHW